MKVLLVGGDGQVARAVAAAPPAGVQLIAWARAKLDITDASAVADAVREVRPSWILNAAAYTAVDLAEDQPDRATAVNDTAVGVLSDAAEHAGCRLLHLSTDFVFDGASPRAYLPLDPARPLGVYGASKLAGERRALAAARPAVVLRTSWVYASVGKNFVLTMLRLMREKPEVRVVCDQVGSPTWTGGIAPVIWEMLRSEVPGGIYHWADLGVASWYDFAVAIKEEAMARGLLERNPAVVPITSDEYPTRARRPAFSVLDTRATRQLLAAPARHWRDNLRKMLDELRAH